MYSPTSLVSCWSSSAPISTRHFLWRHVALSLLALTCFVSPGTAQAKPLPNQNTADGEFALDSFTTGDAGAFFNTAIGYSALTSDSVGDYNTASGAKALQSNTSGSYNTATGAGTLSRNTIGNNNTGAGFQALFSNTTGRINTATGAEALFSNTTGFYNTASGAQALHSNVTGPHNTAVGAQALFSNVYGSDNTAVGSSALLSNTGFQNTATGANALSSNTSGTYNTAMGVDALLSNTTGQINTAIGLSALRSNTIGSSNTATGFFALVGNTTGTANTATGDTALGANKTGQRNTANGEFALANNSTGNDNIALGSEAGFNLTTGSNNIDIANPGVAGESGRIRIGTTGKHKVTFIAGIFGNTVASGAQVIAGPGGKLGTVQSSARFKEAIKPMDKASEALLALEPVTFRYKEELDPDGIPQFGLIAEQVAQVNDDLVVRDEDGKVSTVRYEAVNAMLLNEFLKEHRTVQEQQTTITELKAAVSLQQKQIERLTDAFQKVSDQRDVSKAAPKVAASKE